jgi:glutamate---cysteine ligase / carboxylate-amine ligase
VSWGSASPLSLGVEEELFLVDPETLEPVPAIQRVASEADGQIKPELFACIAEAATPICRDADEILAGLRRLRAAVADRVAIVASGTHPLADAAGQEIAPVKRYRRMAHELGMVVNEQLVCGLHVHVAMADAETALRAFEGVVPWLPTLLALSANSPYWAGEDTGLRSTRAERLLLMPTGGTPPLLPDWDAWEVATAGDEGRRHWDAWPRPEHGTLEVRVMDQQTDVRRSAGFAGIVQALVAAALDEDIEPYDRELYARRRSDAARVPPNPSDVEALVRLVQQNELALHVLGGRPEAERQLQLGPEPALRAMAVASAP